MTDVAREADVRRGRRGYALACIVAAALSAVLFTWMLNQGTLDFFRPQLLGITFDDQARSLFHGHWHVPAADLQFEAFIVDGRAYTYFGPFPALLRMPILLVTSHYDGRLTQTSMLLAFAVAIAFTSTLSWRIRGIVRRDDALSRTETGAIALYLFVIGTGSALFFLGSRAIIYHEPELWGAALTIAAFDRIVAYIVDPTTRNVALAGVATTLACLARFSVGVGAAAALGLVLVAQVAGAIVTTRSAVPRLERLVAWFGIDPRGSARRAVGTAVACITPVVAYAYSNWARFGTLFSVPWSKQVYTSLYPKQREMLEANGGSLFGLQFVPSTLVQYLRPDAIRFRGSYPFVTFPPRAHVFGNAFFDVVDRASSVTTTMPLLCVLGVVGVVAIARSVPELRLPLVGTVVAIVPTLAIGYIANRYLADFMPLLVVTSATGLHVGVRAIARWSPNVRALAIAAFVTLAAVSVWFNFGLAYMYQRYFSPAIIRT